MWYTCADRISRISSRKILSDSVKFVLAWFCGRYVTVGDLVSTMSHWKATCRRDVRCSSGCWLRAQWLLRRPQYCRENTAGDWLNRFTAILTRDR